MSVHARRRRCRGAVGRLVGSSPACHISLHHLHVIWGHYQMLFIAEAMLQACRPVATAWVHVLAAAPLPPATAVKRAIPCTHFTLHPRCVADFLGAPPRPASSCSRRRPESCRDRWLWGGPRLF